MIRSDAEKASLDFIKREANDLIKRLETIKTGIDLISETRGKITTMTDLRASAVWLQSADTDVKRVERYMETIKEDLDKIIERVR